jgi:hypothetical protein
MWLQLLLEKLNSEMRKQFEAEIRSLGTAEVPKYTQLPNSSKASAEYLIRWGIQNGRQLQRRQIPKTKLVLLQIRSKQIRQPQTYPTHN